MKTRRHGTTSATADRVSAAAPLAVACAPWLERLAAAIEVAAKGDDPEGVHQVRVAAGRLVVWLRLGARRALIDDLRWLRRAAQHVRDLDVLLALGGPEAQIVRLAREHAAARADLLEALAHPRLRALLAALRVAPPIARGAAEVKLRRWRESLRARGDELDWRGASPATLHAFRRRLRRVRYALDWLDRGDARVKDGAETLGACNDLAVLRDHLERIGLSTLDVEARAASQRARACELWPEVRRALNGEG